MSIILVNAIIFAIAHLLLKGALGMCLLASIIIELIRSGRQVQLHAGVSDMALELQGVSQEHRHNPTNGTSCCGIDFRDRLPSSQDYMSLSAITSGCCMVLRKGGV